jgi:hypothetical protein
LTVGMNSLQKALHTNTADGVGRPCQPSRGMVAKAQTVVKRQNPASQAHLRPRNVRSSDILTCGIYGFKAIACASRPIYSENGPRDEGTQQGWG